MLILELPQDYLGDQNFIHDQKMNVILIETGISKDQWISFFS